MSIPIERTKYNASDFVQMIRAYDNQRSQDKAHALDFVKAYIAELGKDSIEQSHMKDGLDLRVAARLICPISVEPTAKYVTILCIALY